MFSIITTENKREYIRNAIEQPVFEEIGNFDSSETRLLFRKVQRISADVFILDMDIGPDFDIIAGLRDFKISRPDTRIIVIGSNRQPGDKSIAQIISLGIYDIIVLELDEMGKYSSLESILKEKLEKPPANYADVARWHVLEGMEEEKNKEVVFRDRIVGTTYIAVGSTAHGLGATHTTFAISRFLTKEGFRVAVVELTEKPFASFMDIPKIYDIKRKTDKYFCFNNIDFYFSQTLVDVKKTGISYDYIVIDLGVLKEPNDKGVFKETENIFEMQRAAFPILVASAAFWRIIKDLSFFKDYLTGWNLLFQPTDDEDSVILVENEANISPFIPNPFNLSDEHMVFYREFLKSILPEETPKKKKRFLFF